MQHWYDNPALHVELQNLHDRCAHRPDLVRVRRVHVHVMNQLRSRLLQERICKRIDYCGSAHHDVQIGANVEFDVLLVIDGDGLNVVTSPYPDNFYLRAYKRFLWGIDERLKPFLDEKEEHLIIPEKVGNFYFSAISQIVKDLSLQHDIRLSLNGSMIQMICEENGRDLYRANLIPCFEESESWLNERKRQFISKPIKGRYHFAKQEFVWRQCFAAEENEFFAKLDKIGPTDCRKKLLRIFHVLRQTHPVLRQLSSYHFKAAIYILTSKDETVKYWNDICLIHRFMDILSLIEACLCKGHMMHPILGDDVNLLQNVSPDASQRLRLTLRRMLNCELVFRSVLNSRSGNTMSRSLSNNDVMHVSKWSHDHAMCASCQQAELVSSQSSCLIQ